MRHLAPLLAVALAACAGPPDGPEPDGVGVSVRGLDVAGVAAAGGCSTADVMGFSEQILQVVNCVQAGIIAPVPGRPNLDLGAAVIPYLETPARDSFVAALDSSPGTTMTVTSMMRTVASQYLLYYWYQHGLCGIQIAAVPGSSNHESGLAVDVSNHATWQATLEAHAFTWYGAGDVVHFDYTGPGAVDLRSDGVLAFQMLWNYNHPADTIAEDGSWGAETEARLQQSPQDGFPAVPPCAQQDAGVPADAAVPVDAAPQVDAAPPRDAAPGADAATAHVLTSGCACASASREGRPLALLGVFALAQRRRRRRPVDE